MQRPPQDETDDDIITLHERKMSEFKQLHMQIPELTDALSKDPDNVAIQERLKLATDVTTDINYLSIGPHLIMQYLNANNAKDKKYYRDRYFREALKRTLTEETDQDVQKRSRKRKRISNTLAVPSPNEMAGDCQSCGGTGTTVYQRRSGFRTCQQCGVAVVDGLSTEWCDLSYDERMAINLNENSVFDRSGDSHLHHVGHDSENGNVEADEMQGLALEDQANGNSMVPSNKYKYECRSYMLERLLSVQCLEHAKISQQDLEKIYATLHRHRIYDVTGLTASEMRDFLKICKLPKLYKHVNYLLAYMSERMPLRIDQEVQNLFIEAFDKVEVHMNKYKSMLSDSRMPERKSRPHYGYICRQIARILGQDELIQHFPQLISPDKILLYDHFWSKICECVGFPFYPSPR